LGNFVVTVKQRKGLENARDRNGNHNANYMVREFRGEDWKIDGRNISIFDHGGLEKQLLATVNLSGMTLSLEGKANGLVVLHWLRDTGRMTIREFNEEVERYLGLEL
jgi:hypothetical protein